MAEIRVHDLVKRYGEVPAVNRISFRVREGEFCVLLGPSGCGKTTTLRCIAGLERPDGGELRIGGRLMNDGSTFVPPEQRGLGMVFQSYAIWPHMTVLENVAYGLSGRPGLNGGDVRKRAMDALALVKLSGMENRPATKLSGGQQQRVALARAMAYNPPVLLLDEPLSNLDAKLREDMRTELANLQRQVGVTTVYVTHDQEEAMALADNIIVMNRGVIEQADNPVDLYMKPRTVFAAQFFGRSNLLPAIVADASAAKVDEFVFRCELPSGAAAGDHAVLCVRPEFWRVHIRRPASDTNFLPVRVRSVEFMGSRWRLGLTHRDHALLADTPMTRQCPVVDQDLYLECPPEHCILICEPLPASSAAT